MTTFIPLNKSAFDRSSTLVNKIKTNLGTLNFCFLEPEDWFEERKNIGNYIWAPPPAAADVVVEQLNKLRHKRPESMHLVFVPRLMTGRWRKMMARGADHYFKIDWSDCWDLCEHHEPLFCFIFLPFFISARNLHRRSKLLDDMERLLSKDNLSQVDHPAKWHILRKLLLRARRLCAL